MNNCIVCKNPIPESRGLKGRNLPRYCSQFCVKRAWYLKHQKPGATSSFGNTDGWENSPTGRGYRWEMFVANLIGGAMQKFGAPFDVLCNGKRIDVKVNILYHRKTKRGKPIENFEDMQGWFVFHKYHQKTGVKTGVDFLFCIGIIGGVPHKMWLIPYDAAPRHFSITPKKSKWDVYLFNPNLEQLQTSLESGSPLQTET